MEHPVVVVVLAAVVFVGYQWGRRVPSFVRCLLVLGVLATMLLGYAAKWGYAKGGYNHQLELVLPTIALLFFFGAMIGSWRRSVFCETDLFSFDNVDWLLLFVGLVAVACLYNYYPPPSPARRHACVNNLRLIEAAKNQYAIDYGATNGTQLKWDNLCYFLKDLTNKCFCPSAPSSMRSPTNYTMNPIGVPPVCNVVGAKYGHSITNR